ncbi:hypothetical protein CCAX7_38200 [Capsulimonas corticalis]|uniref:Oxygen sensor histidine kinase NreB n=1 Tax=Capsulimonas corticalis TaxID=2219043 RepID=A0A402D0V4_9BACT|nr:sensor histidine kinase [Capsulimonas corticalis]BDI31769.1 hypothetical protein CCAX7_38200 [Capsulimonas corticalis]
MQDLAGAWLLAARKHDAWRINRYLWLCLLFVGGSLGVQYRHYTPAVRSDLVCVFICAVVCVGLRSYCGYRSKAGTTGQWGWAFTCVDIILIAIVVRLTGGLHSDLWLIYFLLLVTETLSDSVKAELLLTCLVGVGYTWAVWPLTAPLSFTTHLFFLFVTGAVARRLHGGAEARARQVSRLREELSLEREKGRVAREIHDGVGREIVNAILGLEVAKRVAEKDPASAGPMIGENIGLLRSAMEDTRQLIFETNPWTLEAGDGAGFCGRLSTYARRFADRTGVQVHVECDTVADQLAPRSQFLMLRIIQEALNNAAKHANASSVVISLALNGSTLTARVADDGVGFDTSNSEASGMGLQSMRDRARDLGGVIRIASEVSSGTTVTLSVPIA